MLGLIASALFALYVHAGYLGATILMALPYSRHKRSEVRPLKWPKVSTIISSKNEEVVIGRTLKALASSGYENLEIILVDASTDNTKKIARKYVDKILQDDGHGKPAAANKAARAASGEVLYFLDADSIVKKGSLKRLVSMLNGNVAAVVGVSNPRNAGSLVSRAARLQYAHMNAMQAVGKRTVDSPLISGKNFVVRKTDFWKVGGFDNVLTEDLNLSYKLKAAKKQIEFNPDAVAVESVPEKMAHYLKQQERWYRGAVSETAKWLMKSGKKQAFVTAPLGVLTMFSPGFVFLFAVVGVLTGNAVLLSAVAFGYLMKLVAAAKFLDLADVILSPISYAVLCTLQFSMLVYVGLKKMFGVKTEWYKTPKN